MIPPSFIHHLIRTTRVLLIGSCLAAITCAAITAVMLYALSQKVTWEFAFIAGCSLVLADVARCKALQHYRKLSYWKSCCHHLKAQPAPSEHSEHSVQSVVKNSTH